VLHNDYYLQDTSACEVPSFNPTNFDIIYTFAFKQLLDSLLQRALSLDWP